MSETHILIVDDEAGMLRSVERVLAPLYQVHTAASANEALKMMRAHEPELAVLDIRMPELDGFRLMSVLRAERPDLDVIFMTGAVHELDAQLIRAIREKAYYFIQKPFDREVLLTLVQRCLEQRRLAAENRAYVARLEAELASARAFQHSLLPAPNARLGALEIAAWYASCDELGGDLYDYVRAPDGCTTLLVADVSGHGVSAAMITGIVKSAFHDENQGSWEPLAVVDRVSAGLRPFAFDRFVTLFCARVDPARRRLQYVNAGHPAALLWRAGEAARELGPSGPMLSPAFTEHECEQLETDFRPGERLLIYTDGLTEARDGAGFFGDERLVALLDGQQAGAELVERIVRAVDAFGAGRPADDDLTLLTASWLESPPAGRD